MSYFVIIVSFVALMKAALIFLLHLQAMKKIKALTSVVDRLSEKVDSIVVEPN